MDAPHLNKSSMICDEILSLIPDYAFGLTTPEETRLVEANLAACPQAVAQLADYRQMQDEMRESVPQVDPPAGLGAKIMAAAVASEKPVAAPIRKTISWGWIAAAAATIALIVSNGYWLLRPTDTPSRPASLSEEVPIQGDSTLTLTSATDMRWVRLPPSQQQTDAFAVLMWNVESQIGLLYAQRFPELSIGKTYQLWLTRGEERVSAGTFVVDEAGTGALLFHISEPIDEYTWARITEEPEQGSPAPSDAVVVVGEL